LAPGIEAGTVPATRWVPVAPLQQINLKVPEAVAAHWRAQAAAHGLSVRDWLLSITAPPADPQTGSAGAAGLADRVAQLEAVTADLGAQLAKLQAQGPTPRSTRPVAAAKSAPAAAATRSAELPAPTGAIPTAELAQRIGMKRSSLNERLRRMGGAREGLEMEGWRCCGQVAPPAGGPPRWLWVPAES
jgi:hypothetical protein